MEELAKNDPDSKNHFTLAVPGTITISSHLSASGTFDAVTGASDKATIDYSKNDDPDKDVGHMDADWEHEPDHDKNHIQTSINKSITNIKDLTTGKDATNATGDGVFLNPQHTYEVSYQINAQLGTDVDNRNLNITELCQKTQL
ncbi:hypothetical protein [Lactobacillus sp.]|uniref:hypothetical protein n=1 Tax=Lactobacillus sp. TaxID=1591 RepID=UPI0019C5E91C|nr:hypothetical protein [Lactobacillus sp.]MBD5429238.1 hypothetical protein [Lactobacillus sp.]